MNTVKIEDKDYQVVFGYRELKRLSELGVDLTDLSEFHNLHLALLLAINAGLRRDGQKQVTSEWLEDRIAEKPRLLKEFTSVLGEQIETFEKEFEGK